MHEAALRDELKKSSAAHNAAIAKIIETAKELATVQRQLRERWEQQVSARTRNGMLRAAGQGGLVPNVDVG